MENIKLMAVVQDPKDDYSNLTTSCFNCNRSKGKKTVEEWRSNNGRA